MQLTQVHCHLFNLSVCVPLWRNRRDINRKWRAIKNFDNCFIRGSWSIASLKPSKDLIPLRGYSLRCFFNAVFSSVKNSITVTVTNMNSCHHCHFIATIAIIIIQNMNSLFADNVFGFDGEASRAEYLKSGKNSACVSLDLSR